MQHWKIPWNVLFWTCLPQNLTNSLMKLCTLHFSFLFIYLFITKIIKDVYEVLNKVLYKWNVHCCRIITDYECLICVNSNSVSSQELKCVLSKADSVMREESNILGKYPCLDVQKNNEYSAIRTRWMLLVWGLRVVWLNLTFPLLGEQVRAAGPLAALRHPPAVGSDCSLVRERRVT